MSSVGRMRRCCDVWEEAGKRQDAGSRSWLGLKVSLLNGKADDIIQVTTNVFFQHETGSLRYRESKGKEQHVD